ncbi:MAG: SDR family oxidoreductase, partial [Actinomycetales bacterium]|nr:SDR family oxidoreductase [Actinomycetales bacterium]
MANRTPITGRNFLIVGASSGIAAEAAIVLGRQGNTIGLVARRADKLQDVADAVTRAGGTARIWTADATDASAIATVITEAAREFGRLDVVWANAGQGPDLPMESATTADMADMISVNYDVLVNVLVPAIAQFRQQGGGHFVHTNSLASQFGVPRQGPYGAAKIAGRLLIDAARTELAPAGLRFTSLYPGFVGGCDVGTFACPRVGGTRAVTSRLPRACRSPRRRSSARDA